ncbi:MULTISPECIES: pyruvate dehydrogenase complex E1 component subunit beta [Brucella/Ochrobactrum group]|jgi:pyruvate dehydrogenase E1 component beta subunit|uniref:Pyruvate dehydrogenase E1 component subunit beta n=1 Tax=Brucella pseudintermedia TaxID=370111 RepID=A0ABY5UGA1_9HYPH|nr:MULTISPECIES: pyruvate dehydrogenase complex E1 component subunit beta [Brucella/Ochrobactrum group]KAB2683959.1 pyruvate dehydrogenase complex E1 component subunit beta [Brucella pseudintermedia]MCO7727676.1 pyruvate dehydrogenase complex E1 component subunit beta [Brucella intermedia]NKE77144.1 pyruvate dehydrogenase complex E1 component subunit beta [Ochrobactrum sp. MC-1LL]TWH03743.1 pyruvate dehydrogenase E1 component beta subunit [Ochrobactrum sp. J50]UWL60810.1 pyruvate dehydrogenase
MPVEILMPALSPTMEEGKLSKWLKKEGDKVTSGDVIAEIETDKATMEVEAVDEGTIGKILVDEGTEGVKVNTPIAVLLGDGESASDIGAAPAAKAEAPKTEAQEEPKAEEKKADAVPAAPKAPALEVASDPDIPAGTEMVSTAVREALRDAMAEEMRRDPNVFVMGEEVAEYQGAYKVTQGLLDEFGPKRVVDTPITEHGFAGVGVGAAFAGLRPIVEFMTFNFAMQAIDQIVNSAAKTLYMSGGQMGAPMVFRGPSGAAARVAAQHSQCYAAWYSHIPGLKVVMPYTAADAKGLLKAAIRDPNPVIFLENEILYGHHFDVPKLDDFVLPIGKARIHKQGKDATIVSFGIGMTYAVKAAEELAEQGIDVEIIDLRTIRPMDIPTVVESVKKTGRLVTVEEGFPQSSVGTEIATRVMQQAFDYLDAPILTIAGKDVPMPYAANLEKLALPTVAEVVEAVKAVTYTA